MPTPRNFQFAFRQDQPYEICGDVNTTLITSELHPPNDFYGQASVLKRFARLSLDRPLQLVVEHGLSLGDIAWSLDLEAPFGTMLSCSPWRAQVLEAKSNKRAIPIGFGYLYAMELVRELVGPDPAPDQRRGTLAIPSHSTHSISAQFDQRQYAQKLASLPEEFQPVYVCGYWKDLCDGKLKAYEELGLPIVSCGHMYDADFMLRFHDISRQFRYAVSNSVGTHLFQSVVSGCSFFMLDSSPIDYQIDQAERAKTGLANTMYVEAMQRGERLFAMPVPETTPEQLAFVDHFMGTESLKSREELRALIRRAEWIDRLVPRRTQLSDGTILFAPPAIARGATKWVRKWHKLNKSIAKRLPKRRRAA